MALDIKLFERIEGGRGLFAVESISLIYNALTTLLLLVLFKEIDHPWIMLAERIGIVIMTFVLMRLYQLAPCRLTAFIRMLVQMSLLAYWYPDTYEFNRVFDNLDHVFAATEQFFFHCQPAVEFSKALPSMWFSEPFNMGYFSYYPMMVIVVMYYFVKRFDLFEKISFVLVTSFFIYYIFYILVPVAGPQFYFPAIGMDQVNEGIFPALGDYFNHNSILIPGPGYEHGFFYKMVEASQEVGERPTAAFPSSHVGISTIVMIMAWRISKKLTLAIAPFYVLLCCATVYIQAHYLIDSITGFVSAFGVYYVASKMYHYWFVSPAFKARLSTEER